MCGRASLTEIDATETRAAKGPREAREPGADETRAPLAALGGALEGPLRLRALALLLVKPEVGLGICVVHRAPPLSLQPSIEDVDDTLVADDPRAIRRS